jgi:hypothetical protein
VAEGPQRRCQGANNCLGTLDTRPRNYTCISGIVQ